MSNIYKLKIRIIATLILSAFIVQDLSWASTLVPSYFSSETRRALPTPFDAIQNPSLLPIPHEAADMQEYHKGNNGKLIIHLQDAHANYSGQKHLADTLDFYMQKYDWSLILAEGSDEAAELTPFKSIASKKVWKQVAHKYLMNGQITGEEYLNLISDHPMQIEGIENKSLYAQSLKVYASILQNRKEIQKYLHEIQVSIQRLKDKLYPKAIRDYEFKSKNTEMSSQIFELLRLAKNKNIPLKKYSQLNQLTQVQRSETQIDFDQANIERVKLMDELNLSISPPEKSVLSQYQHLKNLLLAAKQNGIQMHLFAELNKYFEYIEQFTNLNMASALDEYGHLETVIYAHYLDGGDLKRLRIVDEYIHLLDKSYEVQLNNNEFKKLEVLSANLNEASWTAFINKQLSDLEYYENLIPLTQKLELTYPARPIFL